MPPFVYLIYELDAHLCRCEQKDVSAHPTNLGGADPLVLYVLRYMGCGIV